MKNTLKPFARLMVLPVLATSLISLPGSGSEIETGSDARIDLYLPLPDFEKLVIGGVDHFYTDTKGFMGVLKIYETYQTLGDDHLDMVADLALSEDDVATLEESVEQCKAAKDASEKDRQFVYQLRASDQKKAVAAAKRQKMRAILIGTGGGVVALAAGLLVGMLAF